MHIHIFIAALLCTVFTIYPAPASGTAAPQLNSCPPLIDEAGVDSSNWTLFTNLDEALACNHKPRLLDFTIHYPLRPSGPGNVLRACTSYQGEILNLTSDKNNSSLSRNTQTKSKLELVWDDTDERVIMPQAITALKELQSFLLTEGYKDRQSIFSQYGDTSVGLYIGDKVVPSSTANVVIEALMKRLGESGIPKRLGVQLCGDGRNSDYTSGIIIDTTPGADSLINAQVAVSGWSNATCIHGFQHSTNFGSFLVDTLKEDTTVSRPSNSSASKLSKRAECKTILVKSGDGCGDLAQRCGIKAADFTKYNSQTKNLCSTLIDGQHVCCSSGDLPDFRPKPRPDGGCATYTVESGDFCNKIAAANSLKVEDIESFNMKTSRVSTRIPGAGLGANSCSTRQ